MWSRRQSGGLAAVSREVGAYLMRDMCVHDDGLEAFGGTSCILSGPMGCGKTTFMIQLAASAGSLPPGYSKKDSPPDTPIRPETVIWRGRRYDYWNSLIGENWNKSYPQVKLLRNVIIHHHKKDAFTFFERYSEPEEISFNGNGLSLKSYSSAKELFHNFVPGEINVVYEPNEYFLHPDVVDQLTKKSLETLRSVRLNKKKKEKVEVKDREAVEAPSSSFWFELLECIMQLKSQKDFFSVFIDEAHQVAQEKVPGELWHLNGWLSNIIIDMRRNNVSLFLTTHDLKLVDYRVVDRMLYFIWMPGARIYQRISQFNPIMTAKISVGEYLVEGINPMKFGYGKFNPIPYQPPQVYTEGLKAST